MVEALVLRDEKGNIFVLPSEYIEVTKIDQKSHGSVMDGLKDKPKNIELGSGFSLVGEISLPEGAELPRADDDVAWPHFTSPKS